MSDQILPPIIPIPSKRIKNLTSKRFGRLLVLGYVGNNRHQQSSWLCQCDCGNQKVLSVNTLGRIASCGCYSKEMHIEIHTKHQSCGTPEYNAWAGMRARCGNANLPQYKDYGGRGIKVCERWNDFASFLADMGPRPSSGHSLDRIDVNGDYTPENCRWATKLQQSNNARSNHQITYMGETLTVAQWARKLGIKETALYYRLIVRKYPVEEAFAYLLANRFTKTPDQG